MRGEQHPHQGGRRRAAGLDRFAQASKLYNFHPLSSAEGANEKGLGRLPPCRAFAACHAYVAEDLTDPAIKARVIHHFKADPELDLSKVDVDVHAGVVTLSGIARSEEQAREDAPHRRASARGRSGRRQPLRRPVMSAAVAALLLLALPARSQPAAPEAPAAPCSGSTTTWAARSTPRRGGPGRGGRGAGGGAVEVPDGRRVAADLIVHRHRLSLRAQPRNSYQFTTWRLNRSDMSFNTTVDFNLFNSFGDALRVKSARLGATRRARPCSPLAKTGAIVAAQA